MSENPAKNFARAHPDAELTNSFSSLGGLKSGDAVVLYGLDSEHEALEDITRRREER